MKKQEMVDIVLLLIVVGLVIYSIATEEKLDLTEVNEKLTELEEQQELIYNTVQGTQFAVDHYFSEVPEVTEQPQIIVEMVDQEYLNDQKDICKDEEESVEDCEIRSSDDGDFDCECKEGFYPHTWYDDYNYNKVCFEVQCELEADEY